MGKMLKYEDKKKKTRTEIGFKSTIFLFVMFSMVILMSNFASATSLYNYSIPSYNCYQESANDSTIKKTTNLVDFIDNGICGLL